MTAQNTSVDFPPMSQCRRGMHFTIWILVTSGCTINFNAIVGDISGTLNTHRFYVDCFNYNKFVTHQRQKKIRK